MPALQESDANNNFTRISDMLVEDASYIRLQNISIGYTFPKKWINKFSSITRESMPTYRMYTPGANTKASTLK